MANIKESPAKSGLTVIKTLAKIAKKFRKTKVKTKTKTKTKTKDTDVKLVTKKSNKPKITKTTKTKTKATKQKKVVEQKPVTKQKPVTQQKSTSKVDKRSASYKAGLKDGTLPVAKKSLRKRVRNAAIKAGVTIATYEGGKALLRGKYGPESPNPQDKSEKLKKIKLVYPEGTRFTKSPARKIRGFKMKKNK